jgi:hypothetical protein
LFFFFLIPPPFPLLFLFPNLPPRTIKKEHKKETTNNRL